MANSYEKYFTELGLSLLTVKDKKELNELESRVGFTGLITFAMIIGWFVLTGFTIFSFTGKLLYFEIVLTVFIIFMSYLTWSYYSNYVLLLKTIFERMHEQTKVKKGE